MRSDNEEYRTEFLRKLLTFNINCCRGTSSENPTEAGLQGVLGTVRSYCDDDYIIAMQELPYSWHYGKWDWNWNHFQCEVISRLKSIGNVCLLYTSDAADE